LGVEVEVTHVDRRALGPRCVLETRRPAQTGGRKFSRRFVHVSYGSVMADLATKAVRDRPVIVHYRGSDLLGSQTEALLRRLTIQLGVVASRRAAVRAAGVIVVSENLRAALPTRVANAEVWVVPSGIDLNRFAALDQNQSRTLLGWRSGRTHILLPASPSRPEKRYQLAQCAIAELRAKGYISEVDVERTLAALGAAIAEVGVREEGVA
jgi:glycosyltransferase involved in cell wall biosynthesis